MSDTWVWWKHGVIYQIYPRSFQDSNSDGIGDIPGIISRLEYLAYLSIDAIWLSPIFQSPMADFGYDISDYRSIDPAYGSLEDVVRLIKEAHERGIRVIFDLVLNHTSCEHRWFIESRSSRYSACRDYYIWADPVRGRPPNNWLGAFGGSAWTFDKSTGQYYLHSFKAEQPDLNWRNDELVKRLFGEVSYWLDLGVDGFRLDVINHIIKDEQLRSNPYGLGATVRPYDLQRHIYDRNREESHTRIGELRALIDSVPNRMLVGEINVEAPGEPEVVASYLGEDQLHLAFDFSFIWASWDAKEFRKLALAWYEAVDGRGWPAWVLSNHDQKRAFSRFGNSEARAKVAALFLLMQRGTPFIYYGEEIGMRHHRVPRNQMVDPPGLQYWPFYAGRDPERLPMQWDDSPQHGFSTSDATWLPVDEEWGTDHQVSSQREDPTSLLSWYRVIIRIRREIDLLHAGDIRYMDLQSPDLLCFFRFDDERMILCLLNFSRHPVAVDPDQLHFSQWGRILLQASDASYDELARVAGYEAMLVELT